MLRQCQWFCFGDKLWYIFRQMNCKFCRNGGSVVRGRQFAIGYCFRGNRRQIHVCATGICPLVRIKSNGRCNVARDYGGISYRAIGLCGRCKSEARGRNQRPLLGNAGQNHNMRFRTVIVRERDICIHAYQRFFVTGRVMRSGDAFNCDAAGHGWQIGSRVNYGYDIL